MLHGTSGAEAGFDTILRGDAGDFWADWSRRTLHQPQIGRDVQLALDYAAQDAARESLGSANGGALLLELPRAEAGRALVRAMVSLPDYDANALDETFDDLGANAAAPLLNRVTQGQYQPGMLLQPLILAKSIEDGLLQINDVVEDADRPLTVNGSQLRCATPPPDPATWADVLRHRCPAPMSNLADHLGPAGLDVIFAAFGLDGDPLLEIDTQTTPDDALVNPLMAGIGQENLSLTPLQVGLAMAAIGGSGLLPQAQIGLAVAGEAGAWLPWTLEGETAQAVAPRAARTVRRALNEQEGVYEFNPLVLSGPAGSTNAWYIGFLAAEEADFVGVVVLEDSAAAAEALAAGRALMQMAAP